MRKLFKKHYQAIVDRGLIDKNTTAEDFITKINEEKNEAFDELVNPFYNEDKFVQEITDIMAVCSNLIQHLGYDVKLEFKKNLKTQQKRVKKLKKAKLELDKSK